MRLLATFEQVLTTSGATIFLALICSQNLWRFHGLSEWGWWFGVMALTPIRVLIFGWTVLAVIWAGWHRRTLSKKFRVVFLLNCVVTVYMILNMGTRIAT
jgi:hypothetical protein